MRGHLVTTGALVAALVGPPAVAGPPDGDTACRQGLPRPPSARLLVSRGAVASMPPGARATGALPELGLVEVELPASSADGAVAAARARGYLADREQVFHALETPSDPLLAKQWALPKIGASTAWNREVGTTTPVMVAIIDTGIALDHPDLAGHVVAGENTVSGGSPQDDQGHGTHVAGIVGAATNNRTGVAGITWGASLLAVKVLGASGGGTSCQVLAGVVSAINAGARVLNLSLGAAGQCPAVFDVAFEYAAKRGAVVLAAGGNSGAGLNPVVTPAACEGAIAVSATAPDDTRADFSTFGWFIDVSAPGVQIMSTYFDAKTRKNTYAPLSGSSMATPVVAGVAALIASKYPSWTPAQIRARLLTSVVDLGPKGRDDAFGAGRIDAAKAVR